MRSLRIGMLSTLILFTGLVVGVGQATQVTPKLIGLFVVPADYATIQAAVSAADEAGGGTVVVLDRPEGAYNEGIFLPRHRGPFRILGVGAWLSGNIDVGCGADVEIVGFGVEGEIKACAQDLADVIQAAQGQGPEPEQLRGRLVLRSNQITGNVRLQGFYGFNYQLEMTDNTVSGGVRVEIEQVASLRINLKNNWIIGSAGDGVRLRLHYDPARPTLQSSAKLEGNVIEAHNSHGLVLEFSSESQQPAPIELIGNIIQQNGGCGIWVNEEALRLGAQLVGQGNSISYNGEQDLCPDPSFSTEANRLFPSQLTSTRVWRVCSQGGPNCDTTKIQEALDKSQ